MTWKKFVALADRYSGPPLLWIFLLLLYLFWVWNTKVMSGFLRVVLDVLFYWIRPFFLLVGVFFFGEWVWARYGEWKASRKK